MSRYSGNSGRWPSPRRNQFLATLTWVGDRVGTARLDTGGTVDVRVPDVLWAKAGDRVVLYPYPDGWVVVLRVVIGPPLSFWETRSDR